MKIRDLFESTFPILGKTYKLRTDPALGDWSGTIVRVERGPRGIGKNMQYRASYGKGNWEVDWIDQDMFDGAAEVDEPEGLRHEGGHPPPDDE
jgi:hypothetical protein